MKRYLIHYTKKGPQHPFYEQYIYATEETLETIARAIVMGRYDTTEKTMCYYRLFEWGNTENVRLW